MGGGGEEWGMKMPYFRPIFSWVTDKLKYNYLMNQVEVSNRYINEFL
jgi:hypothetical protein